MAIRPFHKVYLPGAPYGHSAVSQGSPFKFYQESTGITIISTRFSAIIVTVQPSGFTVTKSAHLKVCIWQRGGLLAAQVHWLLTAQLQDELLSRNALLFCYDLDLL